MKLGRLGTPRKGIRSSTREGVCVMMGIALYIVAVVAVMAFGYFMYRTWPNARGFDDEGNPR
jgi:threonine/homoserine/homoserine lactone efflux protein